MIVNNLMLRLNDRNPDKIKQTLDILLSMRGKIEFLRDLKAEVNIRQGQTNYDLILITEFKTLGDMDKYLSHPVHLDVARFIAGVLDTQASVCYEAK